MGTVGAVTLSRYRAAVAALLLFVFLGCRPPAAVPPKIADPLLYYPALPPDASLKELVVALVTDWHTHEATLAKYKATHEALRNPGGNKK